MSTSAVTAVNDLGAVYTEDVSGVKKRFKMINDAFVARYGCKPRLFARSPGRVNLIGEHIDYSGYAVLPMALDLDTVVAIGPGEDGLEVANVQSDKYPDHTLSVDPSVEVDAAHHGWTNYIHAAYKGVHELYSTSEDAPKLAARPSFRMMVQGRVPTGSGLSSSAAIVCAASIAFCGMYGISPDRAKLSWAAAMAERYVGVTSGGMDQAISMLGTLGSAKLISFDPVRASDVPLPNGATFVVANSLAVSNKAEAATGRYNMRFVECRLASAALALGLGLSPEQARKVRTMKEIEAQVLAKQSEMDLTGKDQDGFTPVVHKLLHAEPYTTAELESLLQAPLASLFTQTPASALVLAAHSSFKLRDRAEHVFAEKTRVLQFQRVSLDATASGSAVASLETLGQLMDASHASCRDLYECSCPELETLVALAKKSGALGSRLTGAGWGGCSVSLVPQGKVQSFLDALRKEYYEPLMKEGRCDVDDLGEQLFASKPAAGGALLVLDL